MFNVPALIRPTPTLTPWVDAQVENCGVEVVRGVEVAQVALHGDLCVAPVVQGVTHVTVKDALDWGEELGCEGGGRLHGPREFDPAAYGGVEGIGDFSDVEWCISGT